MRKVGKYQKMRKNALMNAYITSILCLALCVTMFFGTTAAWFTDTAESTGNEMFVGTLGVTLNHMTFKNKELKKVDGVVVSTNVAETANHKVIDPAIKWEPGYTAVEKFELIENSDLAFSYQLGIERADLANAGADKIAIAKAITVWNYTGANAKDIVSLPATFNEMVSADWKSVGTLYDVITNHTPVFEGEMDKDDVAEVQKDTDGNPILVDGKEVPVPVYHMIALHMEESFDGIYEPATDTTEAKSVQGQKLDGITIKLVATQKASEQDAFGSDYDKDIVLVNNVEELENAIEKGETNLLLADGEYKMPSSGTTGTISITGSKNTVLDMTLGAYMDSANVSIKGVTIKTSTGMANGNGSDYAAFYSPNVTYTDCTFVGPMRVGRDGAKFINCTFTELGNDYVWTYGNDVTFVGCTFNTAGKAILIYSDGGTEVSKVSVKNCTFTSTQGAKAGAIANQNCAAIEIDNTGNGVDLVAEGNTYDSNFSGEWRIKSYTASKPKVIVNGTEYTTIALDGKTMTIDANKNVTVNK